MEYILGVVLLVDVLTTNFKDSLEGEKKTPPKVVWVCDERGYCKEKE